MFIQPGPLPTEGQLNVLPMIWNYLIKLLGQKKARCVANGFPCMKGSETIANTYAACVKQPAARIFWSMAAVENLRVFSADCSNAFAEAPALTEPLYT